MPAQSPVLTSGPETCLVVETVLGGQLVEYRAGTAAVPSIGVAAADSLVCAGWAMLDATPASTSTTSVDAYGNTVVGVMTPPEYVSVQKVGVVRVKAAAALAVGVAVKCGALGTAAVWISGTDLTNKCIGYVDEPGGIASGSVGRIRLTR